MIDGMLDKKALERADEIRLAKPMGSSDGSYIDQNYKEVNNFETLLALSLKKQKPWQVV